MKFEESSCGLPLITVVITSYNHAQYLGTAINSVLTQSYTNHEVIVIDDGSTDNTKEIVSQYAVIKYHYQSNQGLSAARNTGIELARGSYIVFLDADDWLFTNALQINYQYLIKDKKAAFASGAHQKIKVLNGTSEKVVFCLDKQPYEQLLMGNYIGMHATVMYRKWVFDRFKFDTTLKACEDYDLYLKVTAEYPVIHHQEIIAAYVHHGSNMSANFSLMMDSAIQVLHRQQPIIKNRGIAVHRAYQLGKTFWKTYYLKKIIRNLEQSLPGAALRDSQSLERLFANNKLSFLKLLFRTSWLIIKEKTSKNLSYKQVKDNPSLFQVNLGDLNRTTPISTQFGYDRGGPVDRFYIEKFLAQSSHLIKGRVLEIGDNEYTLRYGSANVMQSDILHVDDSNPQATFVGDLSNAPMLPDDSFDCIVLTQTLHLIYNYQEAIQTCYRILKPGGSLLLTVPGISHIAQDQWGKYWYWSFTDASLTRMLDEVFKKQIQINTSGNVLAATAFLYGMGRYELSDKILNDHDPHYQVIITAQCRKPDIL